MVVLVDCNNFYASCERLFRPELRNKPIVVLSNNDGCVVARSEEAKKVGVKMAIPLFKIKQLVKTHKVEVFSSNYALYGDMSNRVMNTLTTLVPCIEVYSIDEAFLDLNGMQSINFEDFGCQIQQRVKQWTGIPVSVGIAPTKTLAKIANQHAKTQLRKGVGNGVSFLYKETEILNLLEDVSVGTVWGIGERLSKKLNDYNIWTAAQLINKPEDWIRKTMTVIGLRTVQELKGIPRLEVSDIPDDKKMAISSLSFDKPTKDYNRVKEYVANFAARCAEKLRNKQQVASNLHLSLRTNRFDPNALQDSPAVSLGFPAPTDYTPDILNVAFQALDTIFQKGYAYKKASIILTGLLPANNAQFQSNLFNAAPEQKSSKQENMLKTMDSLNQKLGRNKIKFAAQGTDNKWHTQQAYRSSRYTTRWDELLKVK